MIFHCPLLIVGSDNQQKTRFSWNPSKEDLADVQCSFIPLTITKDYFPINVLEKNIAKNKKFMRTWESINGQSDEWLKG